MFLRFMLLILFASCASNKPTPYQAQKKEKLGYQVLELENLQIASFRGNRYTSKDRARRYAEFRAIEICRGEGKHADIIDVMDKTISKEVVRSSGTTWGPSYFGMYPYYSRYSSFGIGAGFNTLSTESWSETITFPIVDVFFNCAEKVLRPLLVFRELPAQEMRHLVQDVKGAIQVEKFQENSPNNRNVEAGDIFVKASGRRIEKVYQYINLFRTGNPVVQTQLLREGQKRTIPVYSKDVTDEVVEEEKKIIESVCKYKDRDEQKQLKKSPLCK